MRQKQREMSQSFEESRPLSSEFDENGTSTVNRRDKGRVQIQVFQTRVLKAEQTISCKKNCSDTCALWIKSYPPLQLKSKSLYCNFDHFENRFWKNCKWLTSYMYKYDTQHFQNTTQNLKTVWSESHVKLVALIFTSKDAEFYFIYFM